MIEFSVQTINSFRTAENGHLETCQQIIEHVEDKNPNNKYGFTPLDVAAKNGLMKIY